MLVCELFVVVVFVGLVSLVCWMLGFCDECFVFFDYVESMYGFYWMYFFFRLLILESQVIIINFELFVEEVVEDYVKKLRQVF